MKYICSPVRSLFSAFALGTIIFGLSTTFAQAQVVTFTSINEVVDNWSQDQQVYVQGKIGVSNRKLTELAKWLKQNGPHWTVVLMQTASSQKYVSRDGRSYRGMDAVEYALGHGLSNLTDFGHLENEQTKQSDGCVFVLFLKERKFSYFGSDTQDTRGLGESRWVGHLDQPAFRAMRGGGRILDAVKDTVSNINKKVESAIRREAAARQKAIDDAKRAELQRQTDLLRLKEDIAEAKTVAVAEVIRLANKFVNDFPKASESDLAKPPTDDWVRSLDQEEEDLNLDNISEIKQRVSVTVDRIRRYLNDYEAHRTFDALVQPIEEDIDQLSMAIEDVADEQIEDASSLLDQARMAHALGDRKFFELLDQTRNVIVGANQTLATHREQVRIEQEKQAAVRRAILIGSAVLGGLLLILLVILNRRRRHALETAFATFDEYSKMVSSSFVAHQALSKRCDEVLGNNEEFLAKGYRGETLSLGEQTLAANSQLDVMDDNLHEVLDDADHLIRPANPIAIFANLFTQSRYHHCIEMLTGKPLFGPPVDPATIEVRFLDEKERLAQWRPMKFETFLEAFKKLSQKAESGLNTLQLAFEQVEPMVKQLDDQVNELKNLESQLSEESRRDQFFALPAFYESTLPAIQEDLERAQSTMETDPLTTFSKIVEDGRGKSEQARSMAEAIGKTRSGVFPQLDDMTPKLERMGYSTDWVSQTLRLLSQKANELFLQIGNENVDDDIRLFNDSLGQLEIRAHRTLELTERIEEQITPELRQFERKIREARSKISRQLGISESNALNETEHSPNEPFKSAQNQLSAARAALDHGGIQSASEALDEFAQQILLGNSIVEDSLDSLENFEGKHANHIRQFESAQSKFDTHRRLIDNAANQYAVASLAFSFADLDKQNSTPESLTTLFASSEHATEQIKDWLGMAQNAFSAGKLLEAKEVSIAARNLTSDIEANLETIKTHCQLLDKTANENRTRSSKVRAELGRLSSLLGDPRTRRETTQKHGTLDDSIRRFEEDFSSQQTGRNPFSDEAQLDSFYESIEEIDVSFLADQNAHLEATRSVASAKKQLIFVHELVSRSRSDQIPDSHTIKQCQQNTRAFGVNLERVAQSLEQAHQDWEQINDQATSLNMDLGVISGTLQRELDMAQQAVRQLKQASREVFEASQWRGSYGVRVRGATGARALDAARDALSQGDYVQTVQLSRQATQTAHEAIAEGEAQVRRKRLEAQRAAEAARRRRQRMSSNFGSTSSSGGWSFGGGSSSSGGFGGGFGGGSSSSSSSSTSGFSRSGW